MSQISLKSISGITSITTPTGVDNQFTLHTNDTTQAFKLDHAGNLHFSNHVNTTGISTASNFKTGTSDLHSLGLTAASADIDDFLDVGSSIKLGNAGVVTATTFKGNLEGTTGTFSGNATCNDLNLAGDIIHTGDTNTRIKFAANDTVTVETDGAERVRIDSNGRLLYGQTSVYSVNPAGGEIIGVFAKDQANRSDFIVSNQSTANNAGAGIVLASHGQDYIIESTGSGNSTDGAGALTIRKTGEERLRINSVGAVMVGGTLQAGSNGGLNAEVTSSGNETTPLALINQGTADGSGVILSHRGKDDAGNQEDYNYIRMVADDTGNGSEDGSIRFWTAGGGSLAQRARIDSSGFNITPVTNAARNAGVSTATGTIIYNSSSSTLQVYQGTRWDTLSNVAFEPTGGNATYTFGSYKVHAFTSNGNFVPNTAGTVDILIVAGGGGAGTPDRTSYNGAWSGGGGAGGVLYTTSVSVTAQSYSIVIGAGGARQANGANSTALGLTAIGGGRGGGTTSAGSGNVNWNGAAGGSGGGGLGDRPGPMQGGAGTAGQGNAGANGTDPGGSPNFEQGGGGGGAGEAGNTDGNGYGGDGRDMSAQFGTTYGESGVFGGGGAGGQGTDNSSSINYGGTGGGGNSGGGYQNNSYASEAGTANTGGGGGAGGNATGGAGGQAGGSGIVLIRYLT